MKGAPNESLQEHDGYKSCLVRPFANVVYQSVAVSNGCATGTFTLARVA